MNQISLGKAIKALSNEITRYVSETINLNKEDRYTTIQFLFLDYIGRFSDSQPIYQRDLEAEFNIRRSTATGILQLLEKSHLITRQSSQADARLKNILLTAQGYDIYQRHRLQIDTIDSQLIAHISESDLTTFRLVIDQIYTNIKINEKNNMNKGAYPRD